MAKEICISSTPHETRLAILEDDQLAEIYYERENEYTLAGSIYNGRVTRVLPGMQSAFVDVGLERDAFLYVTDFLELEDQEETDELEKAAASNPNQPPREVHHGGDRNEQRPGQKTDGRQSDGRQDQQRQDRSGRDRRPPVESAPLSAEAEFSATRIPHHLRAAGVRPRTPPTSTARSAGADAAAVAAAAALLADPETSTGNRAKSAPETSRGFGIHAAAQETHVRPASPAPRAERAPAPFVLPGESLSRYGGTSG